MPALIDIRRRIRSVKSTQQITKAMKMVSAAKLRRAQEAMFAARPYARKMMEVLNSLASRANPEAHPLLQDRGHGKVLLVVVTGDKGLCGAFNANIIRTASRFLADRREDEVALALVGRKGRDFFRRRAVRIRSERVGVFQALRYQHARELARVLDGIRCRVNLIAFHAIPGTPLAPSPREKMEAFQGMLRDRGLLTTIRASRGQDIEAACGLLSTRELVRKPSKTGKERLSPTANVLAQL